MDIPIFKALVLIVLELTASSNAIEFDEGCFIGENPTPFLQLATVMDSTGTFTINGSTQNFYDQFAKLVPTLFSEISKDYPGSLFGHTVFADWDADAKPPNTTNQPHQKPEGCYTRLVEFTTDSAKFVNGMNKKEILGSGGPENGLSALAFTASDSKIGWIRNVTGPNGRPVRRVLLLATDENDLLYIGNPRNRTEFRGDGTDTCKTSKPPTHEILREVFEKYEMTVIALLARTKLQTNIVQLYEEHFKKIGGGTKFCVREFMLKSRSKGIVFTDLTKDFKVPKDFWAGENAEENEKLEQNIPPQGLKSTLTNANPPTVRAGDYDHLVKFIKDCLKVTDDRGQCVYGDPEGFNTLGF